MNQKHEIDPQLKEKFATLDTVPERDPGKARIGRAAFLHEAQTLASTVTPSAKPHHTLWWHFLRSVSWVYTLNQPQWFGAITTILLIAALVLGGGVTVAAAQSSQPNQSLYAVKVWSEDVRLGLSTNPQTECQLALGFANRRAEEIQNMLIIGEVPPEAVQTRYQAQLDQAIQFAVDQPAVQAVQALEQIRSRIQTQQQTFQQPYKNGSPDTNAVVLRLQQMLKERLKWVEDGLADPAILRDQLRLHLQPESQNQLSSATPDGQGTVVQPGTGDGNPWATGTATPGSGYGPGPATGNCANCTPTSDGQGGNPWTTGTPTPGSGYGPGPTGTCTPGTGGSPTQQQNTQPTQAGQQPTQQQKGQPTQAGQQPTSEPQSTPSDPGGQPTADPGGNGGGNGNH
jgi:hypothetical protein